MHSGVPARYSYAFSSYSLPVTKVSDIVVRQLYLSPLKTTIRSRTSKQQVCMAEPGPDPQFLGSRRIAKFIANFLSREANEIRLFGSRRLALLFNTSITLERPPEFQQPNVLVQQKQELSIRNASHPSDPPDEAEAVLANSYAKTDANPPDARPPELQRPNLPTLSEAERAMLVRGERVQRQIRDGRMGTGMVVVDVQADPATVFTVLADINRPVHQ